MAARAPAPGPSLEQSLSECAQLQRSAVDHLQRWARQQPHFPRFTDEELVPFVCSSAFSLQRAKACIERYLHIRSSATDLFGDRDPLDPANREQMDAYQVAALAQRDARGRRVVCLGYVPAPAFDLRRLDATRAARSLLTLLEMVVLAAPTTQHYAVVLDAAHLRPQHLARASLPQLQTLLTFAQEAAPLHMDAVHVIHVSPLAERALQLVKPFLAKETQRVLHFHSGNMDAFYEELPKSILPVEYGGICGSSADYHKELRQVLDENREWSVGLEKRVLDESKRPATSRKPSESFGVQGSFRKLEID